MKYLWFIQKHQLHLIYVKLSVYIIQNILVINSVIYSESESLNRILNFIFPSSCELIKKGNDVLSHYYLREILF